jgi:hypothetical protein
MNNIVAEKKFIQSRTGISYENLSASYLRAETALTTTTSIPFYLQAGQVNVQTATERLLNLNDQFVITHLFVGLKQIASDTPTAAQHANALIYTWFNPRVFAGTNAVNVRSIYNGSLSFTINRKEFIPEFPVRSFLRIPTTQEGTQDISTGTVTTATSTYFRGGFDAYDNGLYGFYPQDPTLIDGRQTLDVSIDLGANISFDDSSNTVYAVLEARGYLVVNAKD